MYVLKSKRVDSKPFNSFTDSSMDELLRYTSLPPPISVNIWHEFASLITDAERRERQIFIVHSCFTVKTLFSLFIQFHCYSFYGW